MAFNLKKQKNTSSRSLISSRSLKDKPSLVGVSLIAVFVATIVLNEMVKVVPAYRASKNREVASLREFDIKKEISWEHHLAQELASGSKGQGSIADRPTMKDELLYGALEGLYDVKFQGGHIVSMELIPERESEGTLSFEASAFLKKYSGFFAEKLSQIRTAQSTENSQVLDLLDEKGQTLARAFVELNSQGRVAKLSLEKP